MSTTSSPTRLVPLLLRGRITAGRGVVDLLAVIAFTVSSWLLLVVLAGVNAFYSRQLVPPQAFLDAGSTGTVPAVQQLPVWTLLAACAGVLLLVPVFTLGAAAARMGALGRDQRLATLRLIGVTHSQVVALTAVETMTAALLGGIAGVVAYLLTLPVWPGVSFQATPLGVGEMLLPPLAIAGTLAGLVVLAGASSVTGLMRLRISPLGVARRQPRPALRLWRLAVLPIAAVAWVGVAPLLNLRRDVAFGGVVVLVGLAMFMGLINLVGPWLLQLLGGLLSRSGSPGVLIAGRRLLAEPRAAWRSVSGLAFIGFTAGALITLPNLDSPGIDPLARMLGQDLRTGAYLTLAISFLVAAGSALLNQASAVLDRRQELLQLDHLGTPVWIHDRARGVEVVAPAALSALGSAAVAVFFFGALGVATPGGDPVSLALFASALAGGLVLVWIAGEACRPLIRSVLAGGEVRAGG